MFLSRQIGLFAKNLQGLNNQAPGELGFPPRYLPEPETYPPLKSCPKPLLIRSIWLHKSLQVLEIPEGYNKIENSQLVSATTQLKLIVADGKLLRRVM